MCCAAACLLMPIMTLPAVFGGVRARPLAGETATMRAAQGNADPAEARASMDVEQGVNVRDRAIPCGAACVLNCSQLCRSSVHVWQPVVTVLQEPILPQNGHAHPRRPVTRQHAFAARHDDAGAGFLCTDHVEATLLQCLRSVDFWLLTVAVSACTGASLAFINNASSLVRSLGGDNTLTVRSLPRPSGARMLCGSVVAHILSWFALEYSACKQFQHVGPRCSCISSASASAHVE